MIERNIPARNVLEQTEGMSLGQSTFLRHPFWRDHDFILGINILR